MIERADISQVLSQMRMVQSHLQRPVQDVAQSNRISPEALAKPQPTSSFSELFGHAIDQVNATQQQAETLRTSYETGDSKISLTQVMIAAEKSSVAFEAMTQVRNRLVDAYKEIMNMPV